MSDPRSDRKKIFVVDDEPKIVRLIVANLESLGFEGHGCSQATEAVHGVARLAPDLVILDLMMPGMDGFQVLQGLREFSDVPVIILTARDQQTDKLRGFELAQQFFNIAANGRIVNFIGLDDAVGIYQKTAAQGLPGSFDHHSKCGAKRTRAVGQHGIAYFGYAGRGIGPGLVYKGAVCRNRVYFAIELLELVVCFSQVFKLGGANKCKVGRIEKEDRPVSLEIGFCNRFQLTGVKGHYAERLYRFIDEISHDWILLRS